MKFGGNILDGWFQDELSREKVKLSGHSGELAYCKTSWGRVESRGLGAIRKYSRILRKWIFLELDG